MSEDRQLSETMLEIGAKLYTRRYHRFKDLRPFHEACEWAQSLDWRNNPYDRFLLKRELLRHIEAGVSHFLHGHRDGALTRRRDAYATKRGRAPARQTGR